jgi:outer membrane protein OmpA-like peptidoglycan-associated protein
VSVGLSACSVPDWADPVAWYRDVSGASKDDPKPDARNTQNLQKGGDEDYPNLASVPPPPTNALSAADREKLRNSLAADRANAKYVEGNDQYVATPPQAVPSPPRNAPEPPAGAAAPPVEATAVPPPPAAAAASQAAPRRGQPQAPPQESSLSAPSVRSLPQGETPRPAPPPPTGSPADAQQPAPQQTATLPPPYVPPAQPSPDPATDPAFARGGAALPSGAGAMLGAVLFTGNSARLSPEMLAQVREAAALRQQSGGGTVRVTGYSVPQGEQDTMAPQLASFNLALDRARAVAAALTQNGVPARAVEISAAPAPPGQAGGVVEISLEQ